MQNIDKNLNKITKYLNNHDSLDTRKEIVELYDSLSSNKPVNESEVDDIAHNVREKLLKIIRPKQEKSILKTILKYSAVASILISTSYVSYLIYSSQEATIKTTTEKLVSVPSAQNKAVIILPNGEEIDIDNIALNASIDLGHSILKKDGNGKITYFDKQSKEEVIHTNTLKVPRGSTYTLTLSDGTKVQLNSDSKITYPTAFGKEDRIVLLEGEAYFEVSKSPTNSRFVVESRNQKVEVLGTKFNIKSYANYSSTQTTLAEGSISVRTNNNERRILKPEEQSSVLESGNIVVKNVDLDEMLSWTKNQFYFNGANAKEVMDDISRWYNIDIDYSPKNNETDYVGKIPRNLSLDKLIELLKFADFNVRIKENKDRNINLIIN